MLNESSSAEPDKQTSSAPTLSVIVPVFNASDYLQQCLAALAASHYDDFEVLVVDDGSTEPIEPWVTPYGFGYLRLEGPGGPARARNRGGQRATGRYVVFIDADVCVHRDTLGRFASAFAAEPSLDAIVGAYDDAPAATNFLSRYKNLFHHYVHQHAAGESTTFWSGCGAMRREVFLTYGGFDEQRYRRPAIEDIELGTRLHTAGYRIVLNPEISVTHLKSWTLLTLCKTDIFDRGVPWVRLMWRTGALANTLNVTPRQCLSVILVHLTTLAFLATFWWLAAWWLAVCLTGAVTMLNIDVYRYFTAREGLWFTVRVIPYHWLYFGYCGFCAGWGTLLHFLTPGLGRSSPIAAPPQPRVDRRPVPSLGKRTAPPPVYRPLQWHTGMASPLATMPDVKSPRTSPPASLPDRAVIRRKMI